ncbi:hypothetical protein K3495_g914 [Podosphaera aphanis]|nr:hypothetical protein K3495_g914 [Podosphaera aphanis]
MDDLNGLDWSAPLNNTNKVVTGTGNYYSTRGSTPPSQIHGSSKPLTSHSPRHGKPAQKVVAASNATKADSFSSLVSFGSGKQVPLTLQEQQEKLLEEKRRQELEQKLQYEAKFGNEKFWNQIGSRSPKNSYTLPEALSTTPTPQSAQTYAGVSKSPPTANGRSIVGSGPDKDLFAAFNSETEVDRSSHYPPPSTSSNVEKLLLSSDIKKPQDLGRPEAWDIPRPLDGSGFDDDDPFGLGQMKPNHTLAPGRPKISTDDDDDFLGDLGKPIEEVKRARLSASKPETTSSQKSEVGKDEQWHKAVNELIEMGFSAEKSRQALKESGPNLDIQAAVSWILNSAHQESKQNRLDKNMRSKCPDTTTGKRDKFYQEQELPQRINGNSHLTSGELDITKTAAIVGSNLYKTANSLWKTSQKKVQRVVSELQQQDSDPQQPKWMRESKEQELAFKKPADERQQKKSPLVPAITDEALVLEAGTRPSQRKNRTGILSSTNLPRDRNQVIPLEHSQLPRWQQQSNQGNRSKIERQRIDLQSEPAYISPARRKHITPQQSDTVFSTPPQSPSVPQISPGLGLLSSNQSSKLSTKNSKPPRQIPYLSPAALQLSTELRLAGTSFFKRGDYAAAHSSYTSSLSALPPKHPISIILLCNRALTSLKTGVPKTAVSDADMALDLIGESHGVGETIDLGSRQGGVKEMKEYYGKALMRKAEALEQMERWKDAGEIWKLCVKEGIGASTAIQGRSRCQNSLLPKLSSQLHVSNYGTAPKPKPKPRVVITDDSAIQRLRQANEKAEKADDEKFALSDKVDTYIGAWRDGKRDNLRALLGSLDGIMWEGSGWKKVGMHELVQNNKVKFHYMKAIAKTHPDKLPQDASTEVRMIAAMVFATLNESWDKFKQQNGM